MAAGVLLLILVTAAAASLEAYAAVTLTGIGPFTNCMVTIGGANYTTATDGSLAYSPSTSSSTTQALLLLGAHYGVPAAGPLCVDPFTTHAPAFPLQALIPSDMSANSTLRISVVSHYAQSVSLSTASAAELEQATRQALLLVGIDLPQAVSALSFDPIHSMQSTAANTRFMANSALAAEAQMSALLTIGNVLLKTLQSTAAGGSMQSNPAWATNALAASAMAQAVSSGFITFSNSGTGAIRSTASQTLGDAGFVATVLQQAIITTLGPQVLSSVGQGVIPATASTIAGLVQYLEPLKVAAQQATAVLAAQPSLSATSLAVSRYAGLLNPLYVTSQATQLQSLTLDAAALVASVASGSKPVVSLTTLFASDTLPSQVTQADIDPGAVHLALGLAAPSAGQPSRVAALLVGPLVNCPSVCTDVWAGTRGSQATDNQGRFTTSLSGASQVTVYPNVNCQDAFTELPLAQTLTDLVATPVTSAGVLLSPLGLLTQGFQDVLGVEGPAAVTAALQDAAFQALGLFASSSSTSSLGDASIPTAAAFAQLALQGANLTALVTTPYSVSVAAANLQVWGWLLLCKALFQQSVKAYSPSLGQEQAAAVVSRLAAAAAATESIDTPNERIGFTTQATLQRMVVAVASACSASSVGGQTPVSSASFFRGLLATETAETGSHLAQTPGGIHGPGTWSVRDATELAQSRGLLATGFTTPPGLWSAPGMQPQSRQPALHNTASISQRKLHVFTNSTDFLSLAFGLADVLLALNVCLQALRDQAVQATTVSGTYFNATAAWVAVSQLGFLIQGQFYTGASTVMSSQTLTGAERAQLLVQLQVNLTGSNLAGSMQQLQGLPTRGLCSALGIPFNATLEQVPQPASPHSTTLAVALGVGLGLGIPALLMVIWLVHRSMQNQAVQQSMAQYQEPMFSNVLPFESGGTPGQGTLTAVKLQALQAIQENPAAQLAQYQGTAVNTAKAITYGPLKAQSYGSGQLSFHSYDGYSVYPANGLYGQTAEQQAAQQHQPQGASSMYSPASHAYSQPHFPAPPPAYPLPPAPGSPAPASRVGGIPQSPTAYQPQHTHPQQPQGVIILGQLPAAGAPEYAAPPSPFDAQYSVGAYRSEPALLALQQKQQEFGGSGPALATPFRPGSQVTDFARPPASPAALGSPAAAHRAGTEAYPLHASSPRHGGPNNMFNASLGSPRQGQVASHAAAALGRRLAASQPQVPAQHVQSQLLTANMQGGSHSASISQLHAPPNSPYASGPHQAAAIFAVAAGIPPGSPAGGSVSHVTGSYGGAVPLSPVSPVGGAIRLGVWDAPGTPTQHKK